MTVTDDERTDALVPVGAQLVAAVQEHDSARIVELLDGADLAGLAGMAPERMAPGPSAETDPSRSQRERARRQADVDERRTLR